MKLDRLREKMRGIGGGLLAADENPFSTNKVTGYSLNFPIIGTCSPTSVCSETCYFAKGPSTWTPSLEKQSRLQASLDRDPLALAWQIVGWAIRLKLTFIRWQGGGDMTRNTPACLDEVALALPAVPQWVVTRRAKWAAAVVPRANVYVHFSVDADSWGRLSEFASLAPPNLRWFWSYQCNGGESPAAGVAPVVFWDRYKPMAGVFQSENDCPLNWTEDITGACERCRRCFNGEAVASGHKLRSGSDIQRHFPVGIHGERESRG